MNRPKVCKSPKPLVKPSIDLEFHVTADPINWDEEIAYYVRPFDHSSPVGAPIAVVVNNPAFPTPFYHTIPNGDYEIHGAIGPPKAATYRLVCTAYSSDGSSRTKVDYQHVTAP